MKDFSSILKKQRIIISMVHVPALPGTPKNCLSMGNIIENAVQEALIYENYNLDAIILENMHDVPYLNRKLGPEITASMTAVASKIKTKTSLPIGIQILAGANKAALAVAKAAGLDFIRAEGFVFSHIADEGQMDSDAGELLRYRKNIDAGEISIFTDIKKKHSSHTFTSDISIAQFARTAEFFLSDGLIITGSATGKKPDLEELKQVRKVTDLPLLLGSGISIENIEDYWNYADGFIIGSYFKEDGYWENKLSESRIKKFMDKVKELRK